jgi:uncharacterized membrane protein YgcG
MRVIVFGLMIARSLRFFTMVPNLTSSWKTRNKTSSPIRMVITYRGIPLEEDTDGYQGEFTTRRSKRHHIAPLEYWRGEKYEWVRGPGLAVKIPYEPATLRAKAPKRGGRGGRSKSRGDDDDGGGGGGGVGGYGEELEEGHGIDDDTEPLVQVKDYITGREAQRSELIWRE